MLDCEQSLFFFRFQDGKGSAGACEVERRSLETRDRRATAGSFACLGRFALRTKRKERLLVVYANAR